ncbi:MAG: RIP metalloprotease RseP [Acidobacteria bacterium]|nr:MAG: RIP metalloprotease RseP [Acidobacteriota bacterium]
MEIVNEIGRSILAFIFVLGVMIFVHELGHYLMAKFLGIRVDVFSLGFGPRLFGFSRGGTDYRVSILPLGGYVKMAGENYEEELSGSPEEFLSRPKSHRFAVAVAGPVMNILLALVLTWAHFWSGVEVDAYVKQAAVIGKIQPDSPAAKAGLKVQDRIVAVDGEPTPTWSELQLAVAKKPNQTVDLAVVRDSQTVHQKVTTSINKELGLGTLGVFPAIPYVVESVESGTPAAKAGLKSGDRIIEVKSKDRTGQDAYDIPPLIASAEGKPLQFKVERDGRVFEKEIAPVQIDDQVRIGISLYRPTQIEKFGAFESVKQAFQHNYQVTLLTFDILGRILTGRASLRTMSGPIEIARFSGLAAKEGAFALLKLMALISLQLGIFNLLPIPILDGGVIALLAIEGVMRRDLSMRVKERIFQIGFIFLILLMGIIIINDISKHIPTM